MAQDPSGLIANTSAGEEKELDVASQRIGAAKLAGEDYTENLEQIRDNLDAADDEGTTLGNMVGSQLALVEAEA